MLVTCSKDTGRHRVRIRRVLELGVVAHGLGTRGGDRRTKRSKPDSAV